MRPRCESTARRGFTIQIWLESQGKRLKRSTDRFDRARRSAHRLPSSTKLLLQVARAAERVGICAVGQVLPIPAELGQLKQAVGGARAIGRKVQSLDSALTGTGSSRAGPKSSLLTAVGLTRQAADVGVRVLAHVLPMPPQAKVVQMALQTAASLTRAVTRELTR